MTPKIKLCLYIIVVLVWLYAREWPYGDKMQIITDIALVAAGVLGYLNYKKRKAREKRR